MRTLCTFLAVIIAIGLAGCLGVKPKKAPQTPPSPYHFTVTEVITTWQPDEQAPAPGEVGGKLLMRLNQGMFAHSPAELVIALQNYTREIDDLTYRLRLQVGLDSAYNSAPLASGSYSCVAEGKQPFELYRKARAQFKGEAFTLNDYAGRIWNELLEQCLDDVAVQFLRDVQTESLR